MQLVTGLLDGRHCQRSLATVSAALAEQAGPGQPWPNSLRLNTLPALLHDTCQALLAHPAVRTALVTHLGKTQHLLVDQCWARHQRPPQRREAGQTPHSWHQDGALGFDFLRQLPPYAPGSLRRLLTCWVPLVDCGEGRAPSLAWFDPPWPELLAPASLRDDHIASVMNRLVPGAQCEHATMQAGDGLLFGGGAVHRTHATADMPHDRISLELRWISP